MESSTVLAFRIFVMLSCLVIVPLAAIFGSQFPDVVKTVLVDRIVAFSTGKATETHTDTSDPEFQSVTRTAPAAATRAANTPYEAPRWNGEAAAGGWQTPDNRNAGGVIPAGGTSYQNDPAATNLAFGGDAVGGGPSVYGQERVADAPLRNWQPDNSMPSRPLNPAALGAEAVNRAGLSMPAVPEQPDRFTAMERKLRDLGATYYLLETAGQQGESYRFHCRMAVGNNPSYTRRFEANDRDAFRAMAQVLEQVELWRSGRMQ